MCWQATRESVETRLCGYGPGRSIPACGQDSPEALSDGLHRNKALKIFLQILYVSVFLIKKNVVDG